MMEQSSLAPTASACSTQAAKARTAFFSLLTAVAVLLSMAAQAAATGIHTKTGEALSDDQTFTYRLLDQFPTLDPQLNEDTSGFHVIRDLSPPGRSPSPSCARASA